MPIAQKIAVVAIVFKIATSRLPTIKLRIISDILPIVRYATSRCSLENNCSVLECTCAFQVNMKYERKGTKLTASNVSPSRLPVEMTRVNPGASFTSTGRARSLSDGEEMTLRVLWSSFLDFVRRLLNPLR